MGAAVAGSGGGSGTDGLDEGALRALRPCRLAAYGIDQHGAVRRRGVLGGLDVALRGRGSSVKKLGDRNLSRFTSAEPRGSAMLAGF